MQPNNPYKEYKMTASDKKIDKRTIKTKRAIKTAFTSLITEKELDRITIKDVAEKAGITRKTFYYYYNGIWQVVEESENELLAAVETSLEDIPVTDLSDFARRIFAKLGMSIDENSEFYYKLFRSCKNIEFFDKIADLVRGEIKKTVARHFSLPADKLDILINYTASGLTDAYRRWLLDGRKVPAEKLYDHLEILLLSGLNGYCKD